MRYLFKNIFVIIFSLTIWQQTQSVSATEFPEFNSINPKSVENIVRDLSSEEMQGRDAGLPSGKHAGDYLLKKLEPLNLKQLTSIAYSVPGYPYTQKFTILGINLQNIESSLKITSEEESFKLILGEDYFYFANSPQQINLTTDVIFSGYAIDAPEYHYNDFTGLDLNNKIVMAYYGEPMEKDSSEFFNGKHQTSYLMADKKAQAVAERGGRALLLIPTPENQSKYDRMLARKMGRKKKTQFMLAGETGVPVIYLSSQFTKSWFGEEFEKSFKNEQDKLRKWLNDQEKGIFSWHLDSQNSSKVQLNIKYRDSEKRECRNIIAVLPGTDPQLKGEYILVGSHYDHEGISDGKIYFGADDNASGVSANLNVAQAFSELQNEMSHKRSIIFAFWDAEEKGMLGSKYFVTHPLIPLENLKCVFNMDMIGRDASFNFAALRRPIVDEDAENKVMIFYSAQVPVLRDLALKSNDDLNLHLLYDPNVFFTSGSDHVNFHSKKIPVLYYFTGFHTDYTSPGDTADKINFKKLARITKHIANFVYILSNMDKMPEFDESILTAPEGDFRM